ncbi:MAG: family 78 glycoside hydrolase catalytic domain [Gammaproteobacteria bacterium]|nr:family 78 glycoside hydrolase catalytic domain [Gammaproteobacteria bacterium]
MLGAPLRLRCEYLCNPLGIDATRPRLSWWVDDDRPAEIQTGYHLLGASSIEQLDADEGDLWDTGRVESQQTLNVEYRGSPLSSSQRVWWKVRSFDSDGLPSGWSDPAFFEIGLLGTEDWRARWVSVPLSGSPATAVQVPVLRRSFELPDEIMAARLHITALGVYRVELNGLPVSADQLAPGWTDYRKRVRYQTHDVTGLLERGDNAIGVLLGDGWYCGNPGIGQRQQYGDRPMLFAQINVTLASGALLLICTDHQWKWQRSWLLNSDLVLGESVDARQYRPGWSAPGFDETGWYPVALELAPPIQLSATMSPPVRAHRELQPLADPVCHLPPLQPPNRIYDFGQSLMGRVRVQLTAPAGRQLRFRYAQTLDSAGALESADAGVDWYTTAGNADGERFEPLFSLHGFRYLELSGDLAGGALGEVTAIAVGTDLETTATFNSDHRELNELFASVQRNQRARAVDIPTAGLGSDKRLGWTHESRAMLSGAAFNFDVSAFYGKWLDDLADAQLVGGGFPPVVPVPPGVAALHDDVGAGCADAFVSCAWIEYRHYANRRVLERHYQALRSFLRGLSSRWPEHICDPGTSLLARLNEAIPADLNATALFFQTARLAVRIAGVLGNLVDLEDFEKLAKNIRAAFRNRFVTQDGRMVGDSDAGYALALHLGLLDRGERRAAFDIIVGRIECRRPGTIDLLAVPYLLQVLTRGGRVDLAYETLLLPGSDGWLDRALGDPGVWGAGTELAGMALASIGEWLHTGMTGLDIDSDLSESHNAFRRIRIQPRPPLGVDIAACGPPIRTAEASLVTVNGRYESSWEITEVAFELRVLVPCNCSALVIMPDGAEHHVVAGRHEFEMPFTHASDGIPILREVSEAS